MRFSIFQIDGDKSKMSRSYCVLSANIHRSLHVHYAHTPTKNTDAQKNTDVHVIFAYRRPRVFAGVCVFMQQNAFSHESPVSKVLISLHARILWSLQFQHEHLRVFHPRRSQSSTLADLAGIKTTDLSSTFGRLR